jgi:hypothetical protein
MKLPPTLSPMGCLTLLWPSLPAGLVDSSDRTAIEAEVATWPCVPRVALELRLGRGDRRIDLHQYLTRAPEEMAALSDYLTRRRSAGMAGAADASLRAWLDDPHASKDECLYLEWDRTDSGYAAQPALFVQVDDCGSKSFGAAPNQARKLGTLLQDGGAVPKGLEKLRSVARDPVSIRYVGRMRRGAARSLRVNLRGIRHGELASILGEIGWPGPSAEAARHFDTLVDLSDRLVVAIDVGDTVMPGIGFEIFLDESGRREPRWSLLFDYLTREGSCRPGAGSQFLDACGVCLPFDSHPAWPAAWIPAALRAPASRMPRFECRLSHLKLHIAADGHRIAKAYLSARHVWQELPPPDAARIEIRSDRAQQESRLAASQFLLRRRGQNGLWADFRSGRGITDEWLSAVVAWALAETGGAEAALQLGSTVAALRRRQRANGGWGFSATMAPDADSTAWVLRLLSMLGLRERMFEKGVDFLRGHQLPGGGAATYAVGENIPATEEERRGGVEGWHAAHACVAANAAEFLEESAKAWLIGNQNADGSWTSYWWRHDMLATALAAETLAKVDPAAVRRAHAWALGQRTDGLPACDRAWLARLLCGGDREHRSRALSLLGGLCAEQRPDGSWAASAILLVPSPAHRTRSADDFEIIDGQGLFTTACVLAAMGA